VSRVAHVHRSDVPPVDRAHRGPFTTTSVSRTLVDCAALLDRPALADLVDEAFCRKLASHASINLAADRMGAGRRGVRLAREVAEVWSPQLAPGSPAEVRALRLLTELGINGLVAQYEVVDDLGRFVARLDLAAPDRRLGFEYDGVRFHGPRQWDRDEARYARLRSLGWTVESLDKRDLVPGEPRLRQLVQRCPERSDRQVCASTAP
jgi:very-short-patch-repair endonuclease